MPVPLLCAKYGTAPAWNALGGRLLRATSAQLTAAQTQLIVHTTGRGHWSCSDPRQPDFPGAARIVFGMLVIFLGQPFFFRRDCKSSPTVSLLLSRTY